MNLTCEEFVLLIYDFVEGELVEERRESFQLHIDRCPNCGVYVESYCHTVRMTRAMPRCESVPAAFAAKLESMLKEHLENPTGR